MPEQKSLVPQEPAEVLMSEEVAELFAAMALAQGAIENARKDSANPYFKSAYADLASVRGAIRDAFAANGLSVMQFPASDGPVVTITTILAHKSGQWMSSRLSMTAKDSASQSIGSAITYARRYALQSVAGVAPEDDDGEGATSHDSAPRRGTQEAANRVAERKIAEWRKAQEAPAEGIPSALAGAFAAIDKNLSAATVAFKNMRREMVAAGKEAAYDKLEMELSDTLVDGKLSSADIPKVKETLTKMWEVLHG